MRTSNSLEVILLLSYQTFAKIMGWVSNTHLRVPIGIKHDDRGCLGQIDACQ